MTKGIAQGKVPWVLVAVFAFAVAVVAALTYVSLKRLKGYRGDEPGPQSGEGG